MQSSVPTYNQDFESDATNTLTHFSRTFVKAQIAIQKLIVLAALALFLLLAWHHSTTLLFDDFPRPKRWAEDFGSLQASGGMTALWIAVWISVGRNAVSSMGRERERCPGVLTWTTDCSRYSAGFDVFGIFSGAAASGY
jgi:hypothetical protein